MSYNGGFEKHAAKVEAQYRRAFVRVCAHVERSVRLGSPVTGAPGQPVDTGKLRDSWIGRFQSPLRWVFSTNTEYARFIEDDVGERSYRVGGPHSVKLTLLSAPRILELALRESHDANG